MPEPTARPKWPPSRAFHPGQALRLIELNLNLPNAITLARLASVPVVIGLVLGGRYAAAFWVFIGAGVSDAVDGYIAKRFDRRTPVGAVLDPVADKALLTGLYITLLLTGHLPGWLVSLVVLRDVLIVIGYVALRASDRTHRLGPLYVSKINTLVQIALVGFVLARLGIGAQAGWVEALLIAATGITTVFSGLCYLVRWRRIIFGSEPAP
ncbi:MAG: CDP-alcohol phosphatidyltransferase family protein [Alphaproteobacteria bacterium]